MTMEQIIHQNAPTMNKHKVLFIKLYTEEDVYRLHMVAPGNEWVGAIKGIIHADIESRTQFDEEIFSSDEIEDIITGICNKIKNEKHHLNTNEFVTVVISYSHMVLNKHYHRVHNIEVLKHTV
jgi:hypothetical protein